MKLINIKVVDTIMKINDLNKRIANLNSTEHNFDKRTNILFNDALNKLDFDVSNAKSDLIFNSLMMFTSLCCTANGILFGIRGILEENYVLTAISGAVTLLSIAFTKIVYDFSKINSPTLKVDNIQKRLESIEKW